MARARLALLLLERAGAEWETVPDPNHPNSGERVYCWYTKVLRDVKDGWQDACQGLEASEETFTSADECGEFCKGDVKCSVWQWTSEKVCWTGLAHSCRSGGDWGAPATLAGQRLQHGTVKVVASTRDMELHDLLKIGLFHGGSTSEAVERCKLICYSDTMCRYWQYGEDGCWVERSPDNLFQGDYDTESEWAKTSIAGEEIQHSCPPRPRSVPEPTVKPTAVGAPEDSDGSTPRACVWSNWGDWEECSATCGDHGQRTSRRHIHKEAENGGAPCYGAAIQREACHTGACPKDCTWTSWMPWTECTVDCGGAEGTRARTRQVLQEASGEGAECSGGPKESEACNHKPCPGQSDVDFWKTTLLKTRRGNLAAAALSLCFGLCCFWCVGRCCCSEARPQGKKRALQTMAGSESTRSIREGGRANTARSHDTQDTSRTTRSSRDTEESEESQRLLGADAEPPQPSAPSRPAAELQAAQPVYAAPQPVFAPPPGFGLLPAHRSQAPLPPFLPGPTLPANLPSRQGSVASSAASFAPSLLSQASSAGSSKDAASPARRVW